MARTLKVHTSAILAALWAGLFGYEAFANYMLPDQLFELVKWGLAMGFVLTIAVLWYGVKLTKLIVNSPDGTGVQLEVSAPSELMDDIPDPRGRR